MKTQLCFIVTIDSPTGFHDRVVSRKATVTAAVADGLRWYRQVAARPDQEPSISVERTQVLAP